MDAEGEHSVMLRAHDQSAGGGNSARGRSRDQALLLRSDMYRDESSRRKPNNMTFGSGARRSMGRDSPRYGVRWLGICGISRTWLGYDLLNEPFTPDDVAQGYFDEMPSTYVGTLNELYRKGHHGNSRMGFRDADHPRIDLLGKPAHVEVPADLRR